MNKNPISFGFELEMLSTTPQYHRIFDKEGYGIRNDSSVLDADGNKLPKHGPGASVEIVTPVYSINTNISANGSYDPEPVCDLINRITSCADKVNSSCGFHIHLGRPNGKKTTWNPRRFPNTVGGPASEWKPSHVRTMIIIGLGLEDRIFDVVPESRRKSKHCHKIKELYSSELLQSYYPVNNLVPRKYDNKTRYCWLNLIETKRPADPREERIGFARSQNLGTMEVRALGETKDANYIESWVKLWIKVAAAVAYLPAEMAILWCLHTNWLDEEFKQLKDKKAFHETNVAPTVRSVIPTVLTAQTEE